MLIVVPLRVMACRFELVWQFVRAELYGVASRSLYNGMKFVFHRHFHPSKFES